MSKKLKRGFRRLDKMSKEEKEKFFNSLKAKTMAFLKDPALIHIKNIKKRGKKRKKK